MDEKEVETEVDFCGTFPVTEARNACKLIFYFQYITTGKVLDKDELHYHFHQMKVESNINERCPVESFGEWIEQFKGEVS